MPEFSDSFLRSVQAGQETGMNIRRQNALTRAGNLYQTGDYQGAENALIGIDPAAAAQFGALGEARRARQTRTRAAQAVQQLPEGATLKQQFQAAQPVYAQAGELDVAANIQQSISQMDETQLAETQRNIGFLAQRANELKAIPPEQRAQAALASIQGTPADTEDTRSRIQQLASDGMITDEEIDNFRNQAQTVEQQIAQEFQNRTFEEQKRQFGVSSGLQRQSLDLQRRDLEARTSQAVRLTPEEARAAGYRPGSVVMRDRFGNEKVVQESLGFTDGEQNAAAFANRMTGAETRLTSLEQRGVRPTEVWARGGFNKNAREYREAQAEFIAAILRKDTGAAVTPQEFQIYGSMYFPVPGDNPAQLEQKRQARARAFEGVVAASGGAYDAYFQGQGPGRQMVRTAVQNSPYTQPGATNRPARFGGDLGQIPTQHRAELLANRNNRQAITSFNARYGEGAAEAVLQAAGVTGPVPTRMDIVGGRR